MPTETERTWGKVPVNLPGGEVVNVRVVTSITFVDQVDRGQETQYTIINRIGTDKANRDVHVDTVEAQDGSGELKVERIDRFRVFDSVDRGQDTYVSMDNSTGGDATPPSFTTHVRTHKTKFVDKTNSEAFIQTEWIDEFSIVDPIDRGQETHYYLTGNPVDDDSSQATDDDADVSGGTDNGEGAGGDPIRTDWFQNIVDLSSVLPECNVRIQNTTFSGTTTGTFDSGVPLNDPDGGGANPPPNGDGSTPPGTQLAGSYVSSFTNTVTSEIFKFIHGVLTTAVGPNVTCSKTTFTFPDWTVYNAQAFNVGSTIAANQLKGAGTLISTPTDPPLVVNGKTILGYTSALTFQGSIEALLFVGGVRSYSSIAPQPPFTDWWNYTGAPFPLGGLASPTGETFTVVVSPEPFLFQGVMWKAVGIAAGKVLSVAPFGFFVPGQPAGFTDVGIYIVRAPEADP